MSPRLQYKARDNGRSYDGNEAICNWRHCCPQHLLSRHICLAAGSIHRNTPHTLIVSPRFIVPRATWRVLTVALYTPLTPPLLFCVSQPHCCTLFNPTWLTPYFCLNLVENLMILTGRKCGIEQWICYREVATLQVSEYCIYRDWRWHRAVDVV